MKGDETQVVECKASKARIQVDWTGDINRWAPSCFGSSWSGTDQSVDIVIQTTSNKATQ